MSFDCIFIFAYHVIRDTCSSAIVLDPVRSSQCRNEDYVVLFHPVEAPVVHEESVLNGIYACAESILDAFHALSVGECFRTAFVSFLDCCAELVFCELGRTWLNTLCHNTAGCHYFDPVGTGF